MSFWADLAKNTLKHAARGFVSGVTGRTYTGKEQAIRALGRNAVEEAQLREYIEREQVERDKKVAIQRAAGHNVRHRQIVVLDWIGNVRVKLVHHESDDPTKLDLYYGGKGVPDGPGHGHITMRKGVIDTWWLPGADKNARERIV